MSALAVFANFENVIENIFHYEDYEIPGEMSKAGIYQLIVFIGGKP